MSEWTVYECDVTGERYGASNDVLGYELRRLRLRTAKPLPRRLRVAKSPTQHTPFEIRSEIIHVSNDALAENGVASPPITSKIAYIGVERTEDGEKVAGLAWDNGVQNSWRERGSTMVETYEPFFQLLDEEVLY